MGHSLNESVLKPAQEKVAWGELLVFSRVQFSGPSFEGQLLLGALFGSLDSLVSLVPVGPHPGLSEAWPCTLLLCGWACVLLLALEAQTGKGTWGGQGRTVPACVGGRGRCREHQGWGSSETGLGCRVVGRPSLLLLGRGQRKDKVPGAGAGRRRPSSVQAVGFCWAVTMLFPSAR